MLVSSLEYPYPFFPFLYYIAQQASFTSQPSFSCLLLALSLPPTLLHTGQHMALSCNIQTTTRVDRTTKPNSPGVSSPPPPPYDYVVNNNDNQKHVTTIPDDPWLHRVSIKYCLDELYNRTNCKSFFFVLQMTSLDETMKQMRDALQDTQAMMYETKARLSRYAFIIP